MDFLNALHPDCTTLWFRYLLACVCSFVDVPEKAAIRHVFSRRRVVSRHVSAFEKLEARDLFLPAADISKCLNCRLSLDELPMWEDEPEDPISGLSFPVLFFVPYSLLAFPYTAFELLRSFSQRGMPTCGYFVK